MTYGLYQLNGVDVEDSLCLWLVAEGLVIAGKTEDIAYAEGRGPQDVRLKRNTVAVTGDHLEHGVKPFGLEQGTGSETAKTDHTGLVVGNIYAVHITLEDLSLCSSRPRGLLPSADRTQR